MITTATNQTVPNPAFMHWIMQDQLILSALNSSLFETVLAHVIKCHTSHQVWSTLERMFTSTSRARSMNLHYQLATLKKGGSSVSDYFHKFTTIADTLAAVDQPLNEFELVSFLLAGLGPEFDSFVTSVTTRVDPISLEDLYGHLIAHEIRLEHHHPPNDLTLGSANFTSRSRGSRGGRSSGRGSTFTSGARTHGRFNRGRGRGRSQNSSESRPVCQIQFALEMALV
ncbi:hypothetical protein F2P56_031361 [Juglans regia]|uniref:Uncharacterized protein n=1 Tax=Juglans regia TaxID=51240 RepID=A0A833U3S1_JUGRE|nr:hypothetical protein F2P56_031361 [Juglans regia]